jgi:uncharacterized protein YozE (UPF0346 family)
LGLSQLEFSSTAGFKSKYTISFFTSGSSTNLYQDSFHTGFVSMQHSLKKQFNSILINMNLFDLIWLYLAQFNSNCFNLTQFDSIWLNLTQFDSIWLNLTQFDSIWLNLTQFDSIWLNFTQFDSIWLNLTQFDSIWLSLNQFNSISAISMRPRSQWGRETDPAVSLRPRKFYDKNFQFYLRIFGCSLPEPHNFSLDPAVSMRLRKFYETAGILTKTNIGSHSL